MVFTTVAVLAPGESYAASGSLKITSMKWAKKSYDGTLADRVIMKLNVKAVNSVSGSNGLKITIKNSNTKKKMSVTIGKNGGTANFYLYRSDLKSGMWTVVLVQAMKQTTKRTWMPGFWSGSSWFKGAYYNKVISNKALVTLKKSAPSTKLIGGIETQISVSGPNSLSADEKKATFTAKLTTKKGAPIAGAAVVFLVSPHKNYRPGETGFTTEKKSATTNADGVATLILDVPREEGVGLELAGFAVRALYKGQAKKYCSCISAIKSISQPLVATKFDTNYGTNGLQGWIPKEREQTLSVKVVTDKGDPVPNFPLLWTVSSSANKDRNKEAVTDANGICTINFTGLTIGLNATIRVEADFYKSHLGYNSPETTIFPGPN